MRRAIPFGARHAPSESTLHGIVVVLTGATSGFGHATALAFARRGASLVLASRGVPGPEAWALAGAVGVAATIELRAWRRTRAH